MQTSYCMSIFSFARSAVAVEGNFLSVSAVHLHLPSVTASESSPLNARTVVKFTCVSNNLFSILYTIPKTKYKIWSLTYVFSPSFNLRPYSQLYKTCWCLPSRVLYAYVALLVPSSPVNHITHWTRKSSWRLRTAMLTDAGY